MLDQRSAITQAYLCCFADHKKRFLTLSSQSGHGWPILSRMDWHITLWNILPNRAIITLYHVDHGRVPINQKKARASRFIQYLGVWGSFQKCPYCGEVWGVVNWWLRSISPWAQLIEFKTPRHTLQSPWMRMK